MLGIIKATLRGRTIAKLSIGISQRIVTYFYDNNIHTENEDIEAILQESHWFAVSYSGLYYFRSTPYFTKPVAQISVVALSHLAGFLGDVLRQSRVETSLINEMCDKFKYGTTNYTEAMFEELQKRVSKYKGEDENVYVVAVELFANNLKKYASWAGRMTDSDLPRLMIPPEHVLWLSRIIRSELQKIDLLGPFVNKDDQKYKRMRNDDEQAIDELSSSTSQYEGVVTSYPFSEHLREINHAIANRTFDLGSNVGALWTDFQYSVSAGDPIVIEFLYVFTLCRKVDNTLLKLFTAERSTLLASLTGMSSDEVPPTFASYLEDGTHLNHGPMPEVAEEEEFVKKCLELC